jgi:hypothetical protein
MVGGRLGSATSTHDSSARRIVQRRTRPAVNGSRNHVRPSESPLPLGPRATAGLERQTPAAVARSEVSNSCRDRPGQREREQGHVDACRKSVPVSPLRESSLQRVTETAPSSHPLPVARLQRHRFRPRPRPRRSHSRPRRSIRPGQGTPPARKPSCARRASAATEDAATAVAGSEGRGGRSRGTRRGRVTLRGVRTRLELDPLLRTQA